ncbi:hypothetical protein [Limobrevibacterium gyesilva]|uniref:Uncharacterized protein n=1 Tax=Limobrevibacterium gyesilva TaxID=2991712 RepID=A0AA42CF92_9PROT|nr:hypothetical protein [Limobrevibacterium gyesilva]MCW3476299.1 hypothetical protein [Limobrevibacterium gyesilva]
MTERVVDVLDKSGTVLHTYSITVGVPNSSPKDIAFQTVALKAAAKADLVPEGDLVDLRARMRAHRPQKGLSELA